MNRVKTILAVFVVVLILGGVAVSQTRSRSKARPTRAKSIPAPTPAPIKRPVIVNLKQGDPLRGYFLSADADAVQVEVKSQTRLIRLNEIASLNFSPKEEVAVTKPSPEPQSTAAQPTPTPTPDVIQSNASKAYTALHKLSDAARIGLPSVQYASLLIEVRPVIDESLSALPEGGLKTDIAAAMDAYVDAGQAWNLGGRMGFLPIATEPGATLMKKYGIKPAVNALGQEDRLLLNDTLGAIWATAGGLMNNIASVLKIT